jgi:hypothetical protein
VARLTRNRRELGRHIFQRPAGGLSSKPRKTAECKTLQIEDGGSINQFVMIWKGP